MPIVLLLLKRLIFSKPRPVAEPKKTALSVKSSSVSNSPIANGSANNQNVNAPVFNVNIGPPAPVPPLAGPAQDARVPHQRPLPSMVATAAHVISVQRISQDVWSDRDSHVHDAFIVQFTNEARVGRQNVGGLVKAQLIFRNGVRELRRVTGCWLNQAADMTEFRVDDTHGLMLGLMLGEQFHSVGKRRIRVDVGADEIPMDVVALHGFEQGTISVRLTHVDTGDVLYEGQFRLNTRPPEIVGL
jgi:hypothetical protein